MITMRKDIANLEEGLKEFILDCKIRNLAPATIISYEECFGYFTSYLNSCFSNINVRKDITKATIDKYIMNMKQNNLKETTINIRLRSIRCVLYYFMNNNYIDNFKICLIKENNKIPKLYTDNEIKKLLQKPNIKTCSFAEYRTWGIINFLVATGVRCRTLRNIKINDLDFDNDLIYLKTTKNRKPLVIPMGKALKKVLIEYLKVRGGIDEDFLFCNLEGNQITKNALSKIISKYNRKRGVTTTGIHAFRHYFAKAYIQNGGNALKLQKLLGHSTLKETQRYVDLFGNDLQKDFDKFSPLDNLFCNTQRITMPR